MTKRDFQVEIKSPDQVMSELKALARQIDKGDYPGTPFERVYFSDAKTFFRHITPRRFDLLEELHRHGEMSINALARLLKRNYKNVHDDVKALEEIGVIELQENGLYSVPWDEVQTSFKLAA
ncbi:MAG: winged helix-turn-helix transcriptional regulator [Desulfuromonadaceae bacterium]